MIFIGLTVLSSLSISLILKFNETRRGNRLVVAASNYMVATGCGILLAEEGAILSTQWLLFAMVVGVGFVAGFLLLMSNIRLSGLAVTNSVARIASLGPVVLSVLFYDEVPDVIAVLGIGLGVVAFLFLGFGTRSPSRSQIGGSFGSSTALVFLVVLFVVMTGNDFAMKVAQVNSIDRGALLASLFATAAVVCWSVIGFQLIRQNREKPRRYDILLGSLLGLPNFFSSWFLIRGLQDVPASVAFPLVSASGVVLATVAAVVFWKEAPNRPSWIGIAFALGAVICLGVAG